jgi:sarcosine dehydrogenase
MRDSAQVVIIGGGIVGCSVAYHLTRMGWTDVVLLEKDELTSGSTWHAAGLVGQLRSQRNITRMLQYSVQLYETLEAETGLSTGWKRTGCLHLAVKPERLMELKKGATTARSFGLEMHLISPKEALKLCPIISIDDLVGAAFMPTDGQADPAGITQALAKGARNRGATIYEHTRAAGFELDRGRIFGVKTDTGTIRCEYVVNCTGMWSHQVGRRMGISLPVIPFQHQYLVSEPIEGLPRGMPTIRDKDHLIYYKEEVGGLAMGGYERNGIPWGVNGVPEDFATQLLEPDLDHFEPLAEAAMKRTRCLESAGIARVVNGPEGFTPDGNAVLGPAPELQNCFVAVGFNAFGIAAAGGAGRMLAEWIVEGAPSLDIWPLDIRRFGPHHHSRRYNLERTRELYGKHYTIHWPFEEHESARGIRRSPLYALLKANGAVFGAKYGWERPNWFAPPGVDARDELTFGVPNWFQHVGNEHRLAREGVVLIDQSSFSKFEIEGPGALQFLNYLAANTLDKPVGSVTYTQLCNRRGTIEADVTVSRLGTDRFMVISGTAFGRRDGLWIKGHLPSDRTVAFRDITSALAAINVIGPNSRRLLEKVSADDLDNAHFRSGTCRAIEVGYAPVTALRMTFVGELGYELYIPVEFAAHVYETLLEAGREFGLSNAGYRVIDCLRLEKGYCVWGAELTPDYTPYDAGLGHCVALTKSDFLGKEALVGIHVQGPRQILCTFTLETEQPVMLRGGEPILFQDRVIGVTTSGGYGYTVAKTIAYGYLAPGDAGPTTGYQIEVLGDRYGARRESQRALYDPQRKKILI